MWMSSGSTKSVIHQDGQDNQSNQNARVADIFHATGPSEYESVCVCGRVRPYLFHTVHIVFEFY